MSKSQANGAFKPVQGPVSARPHGVKCTGHAKSTGRRCKNRPIRGGSICRIQCGAAPQVRIAAKRRLVEAEATAFLSEYRHEPITSVWQALEDLISEVAAGKNFFAARVSELSSLPWSIEMEPRTAQR